MKLSRRPYALQPAAPGRMGGESASPYRPSNTSWTPAQSSLEALYRQRVGGHAPGLASHVSAAVRLADSLSSRNWQTPHMLHASDTDRIRHMRMAGLSDEHISAWGQDTWNTAHHLLRQRRGSSVYDAGPRDYERFDNQYKD